MTQTGALSVASPEHRVRPGIPIIKGQNSYPGQLVGANRSLTLGNHVVWSSFCGSPPLFQDLLPATCPTESARSDIWL